MLLYKGEDTLFTSLGASIEGMTQAAQFYNGLQTPGKRVAQIFLPYFFQMPLYSPPDNHPHTLPLPSDALTLLGFGLVEFVGML